MTINPLPLPPAGPRRIAFAQASPPLVAQALADARARLVRHFPTVRWATWRDTLRQLQLDLLVDGNAVTFDWEDLVRRVQALVASPERSMLDLPAEGQGAVEELRAYRQQAVKALAELQENPHVIGPLLYALVTQLAQSNAVALGGDDTTLRAGPQPANQPSPPALELPFASFGLAGETVDSQAEGQEGTGLASSVPLLPQSNTPGRARRRNASRRRTFRAIVQQHPRANGKVGFTVRELCAIMRISAASLTAARIDPGRLSVNAGMALAGAMGEEPLLVFADLLAEAVAKKKRRRKNR